MTTKEDNKQFLKGLKKLDKGRYIICESLPEIQKTPSLNRDDVQIVSDMIDYIDRAIAKLTKSFNEKTVDWNEKN